MTAQLLRLGSQGSVLSLETMQCVVQVELCWRIVQLTAPNSQDEGLMTEISNYVVLEG